jgi:hypothetical protein
MTFGNFYRTQKDEAKALLHDQELERLIQSIGKYSALETAEFDKGTQKALQDIKAGQFPECPMGPSDSSVAPEEIAPVFERPMAKQAIDLIQIALESLKKDKLRTLTMTKSEMAAKCPDCGESEFQGAKFVGCLCMEPHGVNVKVRKNENGTYRLEFGKSVDPETYRLLLEVLKRETHE